MSEAENKVSYKICGMENEKITLFYDSILLMTSYDYLKSGKSESFI
jgi:hypothetical protein